MSTFAKPDRFFIIGAQRSGTTSLWHYLDDHPEVAMATPARPEPKHFLGLNSTDPEQVRHYEEKYFSSPARCYGEKSTSYLEYGEAAARIKSVYPHAKIVVSLRNPVERALSNYWFSVQNGLETRAPEAAFDAPPPTEVPAGLSTSPFDYVHRSRYDLLLPPWTATFGANLRVVVFEEALKNNWCEVVEFLGLSDVAVGDLQIHNESVVESSVPAELRDRLTSVLEPSVRWVANHLGRDTSIWTQ